MYQRPDLGFGFGYYVSVSIHQVEFLLQCECDVLKFSYNCLRAVRQFGSAELFVSYEGSYEESWSFLVYLALLLWFSGLYQPVCLRVLWPDVFVNLVLQHYRVPVCVP